MGQFILSLFRIKKIVENNLIIYLCRYASTLCFFLSFFVRAKVFSLAYGSDLESLDVKEEVKRAKARNIMNPQPGYIREGEPPVKVTEEGVKFRSYRDGRKILLTPESTVQIQKSYGADIIIPLDELPPYYVDRKRLEESVNL